MRQTHKRVDFCDLCDCLDVGNTNTQTIYLSKLCLIGKIHSQKFAKNFALTLKGCLPNVVIVIAALAIGPPDICTVGRW